MRRKASLLLTLTAWFFATGSQWDVVQTIGWARMVVTYSQSMSVLEAVQKTFSGEELCGVCDVVQEARQDTDEAAPGAAATKSLGKLPVVLPPATSLVLAVPAAAPRPLRTAVPEGIGRSSPPLPPPRATA